MERALRDDPIKVVEVEDYYVGDFEGLTTNTEHFMQGKEPEILMFAIQKMGDFKTKVAQGATMIELEKWILKIKKTSRIYFHNLAYDGLIIANWARYRWNHVAYPTDHPIKWSYQNVKGKLMSITLKIKTVFVFINCSFKLLNQSVGALGKVVGLPKLETDYDLEPVGSIGELPAQFVDYCWRDVEIVNRALCKFKEGISALNKALKLKIQWDKPTSASISRDLINAVDERQSFKVHLDEQTRAADYYRGGYTAINSDFKDVVLKDLNATIYDAKSHYPSVIALNRLPHKNPFIIDGFNDFERGLLEYYQADYESGQIDLANCLDFVTIKGIIRRNRSGWGSIVWGQNDKERDHLDILEAYIITSDPRAFTFKGTLREWHEARKFYEFHSWKITELVQFDNDAATNCLQPIIEFLYKWKEERDQSGARPWALTAKIILNSIYGSMGMDQNFFNQIYLDNSKWFLPGDSVEIKEKYSSKLRRFYNMHRDSLNFFAAGDYQAVKAQREFWEEELEPVFWNRWIACYITSIGRAELMKLIAFDFQNNYYCDTDSLVGATTSKSFSYLHQSGRVGANLGQWECDLKAGQFINEARFRAPKNYDLRDQNGKTIKRGAVGIDKAQLEQLELNERNFLDQSATIIDGWKHMVYGICPEDFERQSDGIVRLKPMLIRLANQKRRGFIKRDCYYPFIINQDKQLSKLARQRAHREETSGQNRP